MAENKAPGVEQLFNDFPTTTNQYYNQVLIAADFVKNEVGVADIAMVLGSGLNGFVNHLQDSTVLKYSQIPFMPQPHVPGHDGKLVVGTLPSSSGPVRVMCFAGRVHAYEGWRPYQTNFMSRMCAALGCKLFILTNSAGGSIKGMKPGAIMCIRDHFRFNFTDPLVDISQDRRFGPAVMNSKSLYSDRMAKIAQGVANKLDIKLWEGVYFWMTGPTYETPSEVKAGISLGAGAFGMSTVPEVYSANAAGMEVFAMSLATNLAAGITDEELTHADVQKVAREAGPRFEKLLLNIVIEADVGKSSGNTKHKPLSNPKPHPAALPLTRAQEWIPTAAQVLNDANVILEANRGQTHPSIAVFLSPGIHRDAADFVSQLKNVRALSLKDLPIMRSRALTSSATSSSLYIGTAESGSRVIVVAQSSFEGLDIVEASFLVQVFSAVGVRTVLSTFVGEKFGEVGSAEKSAKLMVVTDTCNRGNGSALPPADVCLTEAKAPHSVRFDKDLIASVADTKAAIQGTYVGFSGPTIPSAFEKATCTQPPQSKFCAIGISAPNALDAARLYGMSVFAAAVLLEDLDNVEQICKDAGAVRSDIEGLLLTAISASKRAAVANTALLAQAAPQTIVEHPQPQQEPYAEVHAAATAIAGKLSAAFGAEYTSALGTAIVVERQLQGVLENYKPAVTFKLNEHAGLVHRRVGGVGELSERWTLSVGKLDGQAVTVLAAAPSATGLDQFANAFHGLGYVSRLFKLLNVQKIAFASTLASCSDEAKVGSLSIVEDHINITGFNPLYGFNEPQWGTRFPDASSIYPAHLRTAAQAAVSVSTSVTALTNDVTLTSKAEGLWAARQGASTLTTGFVRSAIRARHCGVPVFAVGFITHSVLDEDLAHKQPTAEDIANMRKLVLAAAAATK